MTGDPDGAAALRLANVQFAWTGDSPFSLSIDALDVAQGERLLVMGPSGSGKSTLLSLICGIAHPSRGSIVVAGTDIAGLRGAACDRFRADHFGIIFQMFNLLPYGTMLDNVLLPLSFSSVRRARAAEDGGPTAQARRLLTRLGLDEEFHRQKAATLSVGQQQRVAVARALIGNPPIVIADEPTSALDRTLQAEFLDLLFEEISRAGATLIMVSHDEAMGERFGRTVRLDALMERG